MSRAACVALAGVLAAFTQQRPDPQPSFRTGVELVQLDVSVLDRDRRPVRGLTAADFTVLEDGVERPIASFVAVDLPDGPSSGAAWLRDVPRDVASNRLDAQRVVVIVFDDFHIPFDPGFSDTAKRIASSVVERLGASDLAAVVFTINRRSGQEWTIDRQRLR